MRTLKDENIIPGSNWIKQAGEVAKDVLETGPKLVDALTQPLKPQPHFPGIPSGTGPTEVEISDGTIKVKQEGKKEEPNWIERWFSALMPKKILGKAWKHVDGALWGIVEGYITGSMLGAFNVGRGGWASVLIANTIGSPVGGMMGAIGGAIIGSLTDRKKIREIIGSYRNLPFEKPLFRREKNEGPYPSICNTNY